MSSGWIAVGLLVIGMIFMSLAEIWQSAAGWTLSYVFAPAANRAQYLAVFSISGLLAHDIVGPSLLAGPMIDLGRLGWLILAAIFLLAVFLVRPVVGALARRHDAEGAEPPADLGIRGSDSPIQEQS